VTTAAKPSPASRPRLSRDRVLNYAMTQADAGGLEALTMRNLADGLGVAPMSLYRHVANKDDLVDALVDQVFSEIGLPAEGAHWKTAMRDRALSAREVLSRHRWAIGYLESRRHPGEANLRHHDAVLGSLRTAGFDMVMAAHAYSLLDSYIYGFALTQMQLPFESSEEVAEVGQAMLQAFPRNEYPNLAEYITDHAMQPGYDFGKEFEYGLDLVLDGIEREMGIRAGP
jgi:AcrR family transcriptional regulator